jgi:hypothetical protein
MIERAIALRGAGTTAQAKAAASKARFWLRKVLVIEDRAGHGKPHGGREADA